MAHTLKSFLATYPHFTEDEVWTFVRNTGTSLDLWARSLDATIAQMGLTRKTAATKTLVIDGHSFAPGRRTKGELDAMEKGLNRIVAERTAAEIETRLKAINRIVAEPIVKGTPTMARTPDRNTTPQEADQLEAAMEGQRLTIDQEIAVWDVWQSYGLASAQHVLTAMKEARSPARLRTKAVDPLDTAYQQLRAAVEAKDAGQRNAALKQIDMLTALPDAPATTQSDVTPGGHLRDSQKPATKAADLSAIEQIARATAPELYGGKRQ